MIGEFELIRKFTEGWRYRRDVSIGPGDDASGIEDEACKGKLFLQTTDLLIENVHFRKGWGTPFQLGWKSLAVNLSDIAAMGGEPRHTHLNLAVPQDWQESELLEFMQGFKSLADQYNVSLLGGDLSRSKKGLVISAMVDGTISSERVIRRRNARPEDVIWVSGTLGDAAAGLELVKSKQRDSFPDFIAAFLQPQPEVELGQLCSLTGAVHAMIDLSDGLAGDLGHILKASQVGARLQISALPLHPELHKAAEICAQDALNTAIHGGEDYRLLGCSSPSEFDHLRQNVKEQLGRDIMPIGGITADTGLILEHSDGSIAEIATKSWNHFAS